VKAMREMALQLRDEVLAWLRRTHPPLLERR
jgi:hypothetical protein